MLNEVNTFNSIQKRLHVAHKKRRTEENLVPMLFGYLNRSLGKERPTPIKILLDSGASCSFIRRPLVEKLRIKKTQIQLLILLQDH